MNRKPAARQLLAVENGFLNLPMIDFVTRPMMGLAILRGMILAFAL